MGLLLHEGPHLPMCLGAVPSSCLQRTARSLCWLVAVICCPSSNGLLDLCERPQPSAPCVQGAWGPICLCQPCPKASLLVSFLLTGVRGSCGGGGGPAASLLYFFSLSPNSVSVWFSQICFKIIPNLLLGNTYSRRLL